MAMKHIRAGDVHAARGFVQECGRHGHQGTQQLVLRQRPVSYRALLTLLYGALGSFRYDVDSRRRLYRQRRWRAVDSVEATAEVFTVQSSPR
jgi:hypothetical protein